MKHILMNKGNPKDPVFLSCMPVSFFRLNSGDDQQKNGLWQL